METGSRGFPSLLKISFGTLGGLLVCFEYTRTASSSQRTSAEISLSEREVNRVHSLCHISSFRRILFAMHGYTQLAEPQILRWRIGTYQVRHAFLITGMVSLLRARIGSEADADRRSVYPVEAIRRDSDKDSGRAHSANLKLCRGVSN